MLVDKKNPASFRDPSGFLFFYQGELYRQINDSYKEAYDLLLGSGLYQELVSAGRLIPHDEAHAGEIPSPDGYKIIKPERIPFISYPYEWSFSQLQDAALTTLAIQKAAMPRGMTLKDASAYNIQFRDGQPLLIDTLSFEKYEEGSPWTAYRQFCQHFLAPLALMSYRDVRLNQLLRIYIDGIPLDLAEKLLPFSSRLNPSLMIHIHLHAKSQKHFSDKKIDRSARTFSRLALAGLIDSLEGCVKKLAWRPHGTQWAEYYQATNYSDCAAGHKKEIVAGFLDKIKPAGVWDLGANTGVYSRLASRRGIPTVAFDIDPAAVELNYRRCREEKEKNILPLVLDLTNPTPPIGWAHEERMGFAERGPVDTILALALVHHLAISNHVPLEKITGFFARLCRSLIIEFIPKTDSQVQRLLQSRQDIFTDYAQPVFEEYFGRYFEIQELVKIENSGRTLYWMKRRG